MLAVKTGSNGAAVLDKAAVKPQRRPGEALIQILRAGICNTDLEILKGYMGYEGIIGHEFVGKVCEIDDNERHIKVGDRVVGEINLPCNTCEVCDQGGIPKRNHCKKRTVLGILGKDGTFGQYLTLPVNNLFVVPESLSDEQAAFSEPLAAAFRIVEQVSFLPTQNVAVIGDGKLGLLITEVLNIQPRKNLVLFGRHPEKLALAPEGVKTEISNDATGNKFENNFDICVEACGSPSGIMLAAAITKPLGTVVLKTTCAAGSSSFNTAPFVVKELTILGSRCGNFPMALEAMANGKVKVDKLLVKAYSLADALEAIKHAGTKGTLKIQLVM